MTHKAKAAPAKKEIVNKITKLVKEYPIIAAVNMENLPAKQLQNMRATLRGKIELFMTKRRLMRLALEQGKQEKPGIEKLQLDGMPALLFTKENPFSLFKTIKKNKSKAPARGGQKAPNDIIVPAGPTSFLPGPVIGELAALGIKNKVEQGKIAIIADSVVCKAGQVISPALAGMLTRLNINPMEVGLDIVAVYEKGTIFDKKVLDIDEEQFMKNFNNAARYAMNLSVETAFVTKENREILIQKAFKDAKGLALECGIYSKEVIGDLLGKAVRQAHSVEQASKKE